MGDKTAIEWTDMTWNPVTGCSKVSEGCRNCYAEAVSTRFGRTSLPWTHPNAGQNVVLHYDRLLQPLRMAKSRRIFVNSMSDLFHEEVPDDFIASVFAVMAVAQQHTFQILTKRPGRMLEWFTKRHHGLVRAAELVAYEAENARYCIWDGRGTNLAKYYGAARGQTAETVRNRRPWPGWPLPNVWGGVSTERQRELDERVPLLLQAPFAVHFISGEPLLGGLNLRPYLPGTDANGAPTGDPALGWVIVGGESGPHHRYMDSRWAIDIRDQCVRAGVPFLFKQGSGQRPGMNRELEGRRWDQYPSDGQHSNA